jgi:hypothetical protein
MKKKKKKKKRKIEMLEGRKNPSPLSPYIKSVFSSYK